MRGVHLQLTVHTWLFSACALTALYVHLCITICRHWLQPLLLLGLLTYAAMPNLWPITAGLLLSDYCLVG